MRKTIKGCSYLSSFNLYKRDTTSNFRTSQVIGFRIKLNYKHERV